MIPDRGLCNAHTPAVPTNRSSNIVHEVAHSLKAHPFGGVFGMLERKHLRECLLFSPEILEWNHAP